MTQKQSLTLLQNTPPWEWPEGTDDILLKALNDEATDDAERLIAADLAGDFTVINDALAEKLIAIVRDNEESDPLRSMAAISLGPVLEHSDIEGFDDPIEDFGDFEDSEGQPILETTFDMLRTSLRKVYENTRTPKMVRRHVLEASVRAPEDWHDAAIREAAASNDREWLLTAVFCMGHVKGFDDPILKALTSTDAEIKREAVRAAGNWELEAAGPHILPLIKSKSTEKTLLLAAIEAAGYICGEEAAEALFGLTLSKDEEIAEAASEALATAQASRELLDADAEPDDF